MWARSRVVVRRAASEFFISALIPVSLSQTKMQLGDSELANEEVLHGSLQEIEKRMALLQKRKEEAIDALRHAQSRRMARHPNDAENLSPRWGTDGGTTTGLSGGSSAVAEFAGGSVRHEMHVQSEDFNVQLSAPTSALSQSPPHRARLTQHQAISTSTSHPDYPEKNEPEKEADSESHHIKSKSDTVLSPSRTRGNRCCFLLAVKSYHEEFGAAWNQAASNCVALGRGYAIIYDDSSVAWWDIPKSLDAKLRNEKNRLGLKYIALGTDENYFVKYTSGKVEWCATEDFGTTVRRGMNDRRNTVERVAFGPRRSWAILWNDGHVDHKNICPSLSEAIESLPAGEHIKDISMGPESEWFLILKNNSVRADNLDDGVYAALNDIQTRGWRLRNLIFGENGSYFMRYWDGC
eukprot:GHVO01039688.1.p1 GENE.GHVO01039688.1~~GHVO01039688.1.p1  ORF type:complete len:408 (-),score=40.30 GHVO01039688.1:1072-2295(-)